MREETPRKIEASLWASGAAIDDLGSRGLAVICHRDSLATLRAGKPSSKLCLVKSDNEVTLDVGAAAGAEADVVEGPPGVGRSLLKGVGHGSADGRGQPADRSAGCDERSEKVRLHGVQRRPGRMGTK